VGYSAASINSKDVKDNLVNFVDSVTLANNGTTLASNYKAPSAAVAAGKNTVAITPKSLTALYAANNKVFDGNTNATLASATLNDIIARDDVKLTNTSATFDTAAVGTDKTVTVAGINLTGADAANYKVDATKTTKANITAVPVPPPSPVLPTSSTAARVKIPVGSANPFSLASAEELADDTCSINSIENCFCEESATSQGVGICYEPSSHKQVKR
jgi:hypothetical protein